MRREFAIALFAILPSALAAAQQAAPPTPPSPTAAPPAAQTVYYAGPGVTAPELLPVRITDLATEPCKHLDGIAELRAVVDATGIPRSVSMFDSAGNGLDLEALRLVNAERFKPGTHNGAPVDVGITTWLELKACIGEQKDDSDQTIDLIRLRSVPNQGLWLSPSPTESTNPALKTAPSGVGKATPGNPYANISPPLALSTPGPDMSDLVRDHNFTGVCIITLFVDTDGRPENIRIRKSVRPDLDQRAIEAVSKYRFKPARTKDGSPIPVMISVYVDFRLPH
jgi:TonB family protein